MAKKRPKRSPAKTRPKKKQGYTLGEWFMVALGLALLVMFIGIVVTSVLGG